MWTSVRGTNYAWHARTTLSLMGKHKRRYATGYHAKHRAMSNEQGGFASSRNYMMYTFRTSTSLQASP